MILHINFQMKISYIKFHVGLHIFEKFPNRIATSTDFLFFKVYSFAQNIFINKSICNEMRLDKKKLIRRERPNVTSCIDFILENTNLSYFRGTIFDVPGVLL